MRFQLRYGLLTLLVVMAVVAAGAKLWYGPHHVVERISYKEELEYTFNRDLNGNRIIHGVHIRRLRAEKTDPRERVELSYFRHGLDTGNMFFVHAYSPEALLRAGSSWYCSEMLELTKEENEEVQLVRNTERDRIKSLGFESD